MRILTALLLLSLALALRAAPGSAVPVEAYDHDHVAWTKLLQSHVRWSTDGHTSTVDYAGFGLERASLRAYLDPLAGVTRAEFDRWSPPQRMAFLINAYNAWTVELILTRYPDLTSIKDLGSVFRSPWKQSIAPLLGSTRSLDDIEHGLLRGAPDFSEPRIHFAVNCASIGCPALRPEAYTAIALEAQLDDQTRRFLGDRTRNRYSAQRARLEVSRLFDWYADDFKAPDSALSPPHAFLARYAELLTDDPTAQAQIRQGAATLNFLDYDWLLNRDPAGQR